MSEARRLDEGLRSASLSASLALYGGFIGVSVGNNPDSMAVGAVIVITLFTLTRHIFLLTDREDWSSKKMSKSAIYSVVILFCLYFLTERVWLSVGIVIGSLLPLSLQYGDRMYRAEEKYGNLTDAKEGMESDLRNALAQLQRLKNDE